MISKSVYQKRVKCDNQDEKKKIRVWSKKDIGCNLLFKETYNDRVNWVNITLIPKRLCPHIFNQSFLNCCQPGYLFLTGRERYGWLIPAWFIQSVLLLIKYGYLLTGCSVFLKCTINAILQMYQWKLKTDNYAWWKFETKK